MSNSKILRRPLETAESPTWTRSTFAEATFDSSLFQTCCGMHLCLEAGAREAEVLVSQEVERL